MNLPPGHGLFRALVEDTAPPTLQQLAERVLVAEQLENSATDREWSQRSDALLVAERDFQAAFWRVTGLDPATFRAVRCVL